MKVHKLPLIINGKGKQSNRLFVQVAASEKAYIYKVTPQKGAKYFEVFKRTTTPICLDFQQRLYSDTESKEVYPKAESFGKIAWCTWTHKKAFERFSKLSVVEPKS